MKPVPGKSRAARIKAHARTSRVADYFYWLILAITAANYSVLTFRIDGEDDFYNPLKPLAYVRLPLAVIGYFYLVFTDRTGFRIRNAGAPVLALVVCSVLAMPFAQSLWDAFTYTTWFVFQLLFLAKYISHLGDRIDVEQVKLKLFFPLFLVGAYFILLSLLAFPSYSIGRPFPALFSTRTQVAMHSPLFVGGLACCLAMLSKRKLIYLLFLALGVFSLAVVAVSGKRASMVCTLIVLASFFIFQLKIWGKLAAALLIPIALYLAVSTGFQNTAEEATEYSRVRIEKGMSEDTATSINARFSIWEIGRELALTRPLGVGVNGGRDLVGGGLHNTYLGYLIETGWIGFVLVMVLLFSACFKAFFSSSEHHRQVLFYMTIPVALYSFTEYNSAPGQPLFVAFWVCILFPWIASRRKRNLRPHVARH